MVVDVEKELAKLREQAEALTTLGRLLRLAKKANLPFTVVCDKYKEFLKEEMRKSLP